MAARVRELTAFLVEEPRQLAGMSSEAAAAFSDLEPMRDRARQIRLDTLWNLDRYLGESNECPRRFRRCQFLQSPHKAGVWVPARRLLGTPAPSPP